MKASVLLLLIGITGCCQCTQRFVSIGDGSTGLALDTKTGQRCVTYPKKQGETWQLPFCADLK
jgi:hypothetical protein